MKPSLKIIVISALLASAFALGYALGNRQVPEKDWGKPRVTGIGGIFFKCKDPKAVKEWYSKHLGLNTDKYGTNFQWYEGADSTIKAATQWSPFSEKTNYFAPSTKDFMINYRVRGIETLVAQFKRDSVTVLDTIETYDYGKFVHILDLEGNKIELWEPVDSVYNKYVGAVTK